MLEKLEWLDDPRVFRVGKLPTHSDHTMYRTTDEIKQKQSSFTKSLDGDWRFHFSENPSQRLIGFEQLDFDVDQFEHIAVPGHIEL